MCSHLWVKTSRKFFGSPVSECKRCGKEIFTVCVPKKVRA